MGLRKNEVETEAEGIPFDVIDKRVFENVLKPVLDMKELVNDDVVVSGRIPEGT